MSFDRDLDVVVRWQTEAPPDGRPPAQRIGAIGLWGFVMLLAAVVAASTGAKVALWATVAALGALLVRVGVSAGERLRSVTERHRIRIDDEALHVDGRRRIMLDEIGDAHVQPRPHGPSTVCVRGRHGDVLMEIASEGPEAEALLCALGRDVGQRRQTLRVSNPLASTPTQRLASLAALVATVIAFGSLATAAVTGAFAFFAVVGWLLLMTHAATVDLGADGILVTWLGRRRFLSFADVVAVKLVGPSVRIVLRGRGHVDLEITRQRVEETKLAREALRARIERARAAHAAAGPKELAGRLARGDRPVDAWRADVEGLCEGTCRAPALREDDLWRIVEGASVPAEARAVAAMALRHRDHAAPRLRVAAGALASPQLRVAIERAANLATPEAELDEALEQVTRSR